jgi:hypothetical protein
LRAVHGDPVEATPDHLRPVIDDHGLRVVDGGVFAVSVRVEDLAHHALG